MRLLLVSLLAGFGVLMCASAAPEKPSYPPTKTEPAEKAVETLHGVKVADPYRWLEDGERPEVQAWVNQQNAYTRSVLDRLPGREEIRARLGKLLEIGRIGTPQPAKGRYFYTKREGTQNQDILYVREGLRGQERVLLDPNQLSSEGSVALDWWHPSHDGTLVVYGLSRHGDEESTLYIRDVLTGKDLPDQIERTRHASIAWTPDGKGFYYTRYPQRGSVPKGEENYHRHIYYHALGADPGKDSKIFGEGRQPEDWPAVDLSPDGRWLLITVEQGWSKTEVYLKDLKTGGPFVPVIEKVEAIYDASIRNDVLYIRTNEKAPRCRVFKVDPAKPAREHWQEIVKEETDVLEGISAVGDKLIARYMHKAASRLRVLTREGTLVHDVELGTLGTIIGLGGEWDGTEVLYGFSSFTIPPSIYQLDLKSPLPGGEARVRGMLWERVQTDIETAAYEAKQVTYPSKDGTPITMFLAHRKGLKLDGNQPVFLTGYGGFNVSQTPMFGGSLFLFLERGGILAMPNLRGGGEYGERWHQAGMLGNKQNVFDDFLAAAEWLIANKYTNPKRLAIAGGSNGGLLIGAAVTQRPELFRVAICSVPLLDMLRYHKFRIARLWIPEYGDPDDLQAFQWLRAYSPYHRVKTGTAYPAILFTAAEGDSRVDPFHARKMTALMQAAPSSEQPILLRHETKAGHGAGKPRVKVLEEMTDRWSFVFWQLGIE